MSWINKIVRDVSSLYILVFMVYWINIGFNYNSIFGI